METNDETTDEEVISCEDCGNTLNPDDDYMELTLCSHCVRTCDSCEEFMPDNPRNDGRRFNDYCKGCEDNYFVCEYCNEVNHLDDSRYISDVDGLYCESCCDYHSVYCEECDEYNLNGCDCSSANEDGIYEYDYKPDPIFHASRPNEKVFFGFELEVESVNSDLSDGVDIVRRYTNEGLVYLKQDGSINYGFEIVTHPMTHEWAMQSFPWQMIEDLRKQGFRSWDTDTCGLHVHVSRRAFEDRAHLWKWTYLINKNATRCIELAGRNSSYAEFNSVKATSDIVLQKERADRKYSAINMLPRNTIEVRIFKGSLRIPRVKTALDFMQSSVEFTNKMTLKDINRGVETWDMFKEYVHENANRFDSLNLRLNADKLVDNQA